jgi:hypothetical protein
MKVLYSYVWGSAGREKTPRTPKPPRERRLTRPTVVRILVRARACACVHCACWGLATTHDTDPRTNPRFGTPNPWQELSIRHLPAHRQRGPTSPLRPCRGRQCRTLLAPIGTGDEEGAGSAAGVDLVGSETLLGSGKGAPAALLGRFLLYSNNSQPFANHEMANA